MSLQNKFTEQHWQVVADGIKADIVSAKDLWEHALVFFQWCDGNPIYRPEMMRSGADAGIVYYVPIPRPYTISGLCIHLGITKEYIYTVAKSDVKDDFYFVANKLLEIIHTQKLEYTYAGVYSPVVAAKELGLAHIAPPEKSSPVINITVEGVSGGSGDGSSIIPLLSDERDVELPEDKR
jgi:hypothetical protein